MEEGEAELHKLHRHSKHLLLFSTSPPLCLIPLLPSLPPLTTTTHSLKMTNALGAKQRERQKSSEPSSDVPQPHRTQRTAGVFHSDGVKR